MFDLPSPSWILNSFAVKDQKMQRRCSVCRLKSLLSQTPSLRSKLLLGLAFFHRERVFSLRQTMVCLSYDGILHWPVHCVCCGQRSPCEKGPTPTVPSVLAACRCERAPSDHPAPMTICLLGLLLNSKADTSASASSIFCHSRVSFFWSFISLEGLQCRFDDEGLATFLIS